LRRPTPKVPARQNHKDNPHPHNDLHRHPLYHQYILKYIVRGLPALMSVPSGLEERSFGP
jgi:hypothetical protein